MSTTKIVTVLLRGLPNTLSLMVASFCLATGLGIFLAWVNLRPSWLAREGVRLYLGLVRGTPPLLMLLLTYYGLPVLLKTVGINIDGWTRWTFGTLGLTIGWSAYLSEAFRSAYLAVDPGQLEAARAVGMADRQIFWQIIGPQAALIALPNIENLLIGLVKATSLVYVVGLYDMYNQAVNLSNQTAGIHQLQIFIILALFYWGVVLIIEWGFRRIRGRFAGMTN